MWTNGVQEKGVFVKFLNDNNPRESIMAMWIEGIELIRSGDAIIIKGAKGFVECNLHCILFSLKCIEIHEINKYFWILCSFTHEIIVFESFQYVVKVLLHTQYTFWIVFS